MLYLKLFFLSLPFLAILDFIWLGVLMSGFYNQELGALARREGAALAPHWPSAILVYVLLAFGTAVLVVPRFSTSSVELLVGGAIFGLVVYGIYDLTNYATLAGWSGRLVVIDILWGMTIGALSALGTGLLARWLRIL